jgi:hypothetical protein
MNSNTAVQVSDTTGADQGTKAGNINKIIQIIYIKVIRGYA